MSDDKTATLYRMILPEETCPFGVRAKQMLEQKGFAIKEHILRSRYEVEAFEREHGVETRRGTSLVASGSAAAARSRSISNADRAEVLQD